MRQCDHLRPSSPRDPPYRMNSNTGQILLAAGAAAAAALLVAGLLLYRRRRRRRE